MKIEVPERVIDSNIGGQTIDFRLDNDSHILFDILRKKMYPDPIRAICREITANARDAHREVGKDNVPVQIWVPGDYLVIKDFGPGISPDRMAEVFCYYGRSTKRGDNKQTGGFGLGAKTPFAYTDQFIIETIVDGTKYTYVAKIDETHKGNIDLMGSEATTESNGTAIKMPVKPGDRYLFQNNLLIATKFWDVQPKFVGQIPQEPFKPTLEDEKWAIYLKDTGGYNILVDGVPYADHEHDIPSKVVLKFAVGEVELSSNRDHLHNSETTRNAIKAALANFMDAVVKRVQDQLNTVETFGEVVTLIDGIPKTRTGDKRDWTWKGQTFTYPFKDSVTCYERPRQKLQSFNARVVQDNVTDESFVELDKDEVTSYDRQRIGSYLNQKNLNKVYLIPSGLLPVNATKLTSIRVIRTKTPGVKKTKTTIKGRAWRNRRQDDYLIDSPNPIVYITDRIDALRSVFHLHATLVEISDKDVKHIDDEPNWIPLDEYLQQNLYDKVKTEEVQEIANIQAGVNAYQNFSFLASHHKDFAFLDKKKVDKKHSERILELINFLVDNNKVTPVVPDLYKKYEMLKLCRYISYSDHDTVKNYVDLVNKQENQNG